MQQYFIIRVIQPQKDSRVSSHFDAYRFTALISSLLSFAAVMFAKFLCKKTFNLYTNATCKCFQGLTKICI